MSWNYKNKPVGTVEKNTTRGLCNENGSWCFICSYIQSNTTMKADTFKLHCKSIHELTRIYTRDGESVLVNNIFDWYTKHIMPTYEYEDPLARRTIKNKVWTRESILDHVRYNSLNNVDEALNYYERKRIAGKLRQDLYDEDGSLNNAVYDRWTKVQMETLDYKIKAFSEDRPKKRKK